MAYPISLREHISNPIINCLALEEGAIVDGELEISLLPALVTECLVADPESLAIHTRAILPMSSLRPCWKTHGAWTLGEGKNTPQNKNGTLGDVSNMCWNEGEYHHCILKTCYESNSVDSYNDDFKDKSPNLYQVQSRCSYGGLLGVCSCTFMKTECDVMQRSLLF